MFACRYKWRKNWRFSHLVAQLAAPVALDQVWVLQVVVVHPDHLLQVPAVRVDRVADQLVRWLAAGRCEERAARVKTVATQLAADIQTVATQLAADIKTVATQLTYL